MDAHEEREQARADFKIALTGLGIAVVGLAIIMGAAAFLAIALH
jgi:hypothetical protein